MRKTLLIVPFFGELPPWFDRWRESIGRLEPYGYDVLLDRDEDGFRERADKILAVDAPPLAGTGKAWDFRPALGVLYDEELAGYDFWGHTDLDVVYGRVWEWITDEFLDSVDLHSNHHDYVCGFWSTYRNKPPVNELFRRTPNWAGLMESPRASGWIETAYTATVDQAHRRGEIRRAYTHWQTEDLNNYDTLRWDGDRLVEGDREVFAAHFRRTKAWPEQC